MTMPKVLEKLVHHHEKPNPEMEMPKEQPTTPPTEPHHSFLHKLAHPLEKKPQSEENTESKKEHHHHHHPHLHHPNYHQDPVYAHHAADSKAPVPAEEHKPEQVSTVTPPTTPPRASSPIHKGWERIKKIAHNHHEAANESFDGYYGALTEGAAPTTPDRQASLEEAGPSTSTAGPSEQHETKEHAIARLGAIERERHHREHTMGYGVAAV